MTTLGVYLMFGDLLALTFWCMATSGTRDHVDPPVPLVPPIRCTGCVYDTRIDPRHVGFDTPIRA